MKNIAKPILYVLIGSACAFALLWIGGLVYPLPGYRSTGPVGDGFLGILLIAIVTLVAGFLISIAYEVGKFIMEKLL